ncbi:Protein of unknown function [Pyronema omphalodes CBS 100304]|uniref:Uncharacterized protein n=1 Tax=Pyronema omphalodes (strain CBS 100304) TaxID=1076935 RepID=U4L2L0_PYROM|nr:Protein of unknown function [Pyronema omphalodes CBS 100304]
MVDRGGFEQRWRWKWITE